MQYVFAFVAVFFLSAATAIPAYALSDAANKMCLPETGQCKYGTYCDPPFNKVKGVVGKYCQDVTNKGITKGVCISKEKCLGKTFVGLDGKEQQLTDPDTEEKLPYINDKGEHCFTGGGCAPAELTPNPQKGFVGEKVPLAPGATPGALQPGSSIFDAATLDLQQPGTFDKAPSADAFQQFLEQSQAQHGGQSAPQSVGEQLQQWGAAIPGLGNGQTLTPVDSAGNPTGGQFDSGGYEIPGGTTGFGAPEQTADSGSAASESGATGACDSWWCTYIGGVTPGQETTSQPQSEPLRAGPDGKVNPVELYGAARDAFQKALDANGGSWSKATLDAFRRMGVTDPTDVDQLARAAVQLAKTESSFNASLVSKYDAARGLNSEGLYQFNNNGGDIRYGIGPGDAHNPQKAVEGLVKVAEQGQLSNYFGPIKRGGELVRNNAGWFAANVAPYVGQGSTQVASLDGYVPQSVAASVDPWSRGASALPYMPTSQGYDWSATPFQFQPATEYPSLATPQTEESPYASAPSWAPVSADLSGAGVAPAPVYVSSGEPPFTDVAANEPGAVYTPGGEPPFTDVASAAPVPVYTPGGEPPFTDVATRGQSTVFASEYFDPNYLNLAGPVGGTAIDTNLAFDASPINPGNVDAIADGAVPTPESAATDPQSLIQREIDSRVPVPAAAATDPQGSVVAQNAIDAREAARLASEGLVSGRDESAFTKISSAVKDTWSSIYGTVSTLGSDAIARISGTPPVGPDTMAIETGGASNPITEGAEVPPVSGMDLEGRVETIPPPGSDRIVPLPQGISPEIVKNVWEQGKIAASNIWESVKGGWDYLESLGTPALQGFDEGGFTSAFPSDTSGLQIPVPESVATNMPPPDAQAAIEQQNNLEHTPEPPFTERGTAEDLTPLPRSRPADIAAISAPPAALGDSYSLGEKDPGVKRLQEFLNTQGAKLAEDGVYGAQTEAAVEDFQKRENLKEVDGLAGPKTLARMNDIIAKGAGQGGIGSDYAAGPLSIESSIPVPESADVSLPSQSEMQRELEQQRASEQSPVPEQQTFSQFLQEKIADTWGRVKDLFSDAIAPSASLSDMGTGYTDISSSLGNLGITPDSLAEIESDMDQVIREATESLPEESPYVTGSAGEEVLPPESLSEQKPDTELASEPTAQEPPRTGLTPETMSKTRSAFDKIKEKADVLSSVRNNPNSTLDQFYGAGDQLKKALSDSKPMLVEAHKEALEVGNKTLAEQIQTKMNQVGSAIKKLDDTRATINAEIAKNTFAASLLGIDVRASAMNQIRTDLRIQSGLVALKKLPVAVWVAQR